MSRRSVFSSWTLRVVRWFSLCCVMVLRRNVFNRRMAEKLLSLAYRRKDDNRRLRVEIAIRAIASEFTIP